MPARRLIVHGRVQGVNFRHATRRVARGLGVAGWVRNRSDGAVEAHLEGDAEAIDEVEGWIAGGGPTAARVAEVDADDATVEGLEDFEVRG